MSVWCFWRVFHRWLRFITFGGRSAHLAYHVHWSARKTSIVICNSELTFIIKLTGFFTNGTQYSQILSPHLDLNRFGVVSKRSYLKRLIELFTEYLISYLTFSAYQNCNIIIDFTIVEYFNFGWLKFKPLSTIKSHIRHRYEYSVFFSRFHSAIVAEQIMYWRHQRV